MSIQAVSAGNHATQVSASFAQGPQGTSAVVASSKPEPRAAQSNNATTSGPRADVVASNYFAKADATQAKLRQTLPAGVATSNGGPKAELSSVTRSEKTEPVQSARIAQASDNQVTSQQNRAYAIQALTTKLAANPTDWQTFNALNIEVILAVDSGTFKDASTLNNARSTLASTQRKAQNAWRSDFEGQMREAKELVNIVTRPGYEPWAKLTSPLTEDLRSKAWDAVEQAQSIASQAPESSSEEAAVKRADELFHTLKDRGIDDPESVGGDGE